jgi:uncharacterized protein with HEPN domain
MSQPRQYRGFVEDILQASKKAAEFPGGLSLAEFAQHEKTAFAVVRALEIVGEAAKRISRKRSATAIRKSLGARCPASGTS